MYIYDKDYRILNEEEKKKDEKLKLKYTGKIGEINSKYNWERSKEMTHYDSLFPNNLLDLRELTNYKEKLHELNLKYNEIIDIKTTKELDLKKFIKDNKAYHIIGSILKSGFNFGHHEIYIFPEFQFGNIYKADYLIVGKNSDGYHFVFVEMESIYGSISLQDENFGENIRKGINQVKDWKNWIQSNFNCLDFSVHTKQGASIPNEFNKFNSSRIHYVVVVGRRSDFKLKFRDEIRSLKDDSKTTILHHDNLFDNAEMILEHGNY